MIFSNILLAAVTYISPVHFDVSLAGNFGEPRPNHFHAGLDIKTQQVEGKAVYSIGDGFVCRVSKNVGGMGNAIYVRHPDGYTSVYAHLQRFTPAIEAVVRKWQYKNQSDEIDIQLDATVCPVAKGQLIALSGDSGASLGPHLHLEIHQNDTWDILDPLDFMPDLLQDSVCPKVHAIMAYPVNGQGMVCGKNTPVRFDFENDQISDSVVAWGKVGFGIYADDFMQGSSNKFGIRYTALYVDGKEVFSSNIDYIPVDCHRMVNLWGDYDYYAAKQQWFLKSFLVPGNTLPFIKTDASKGIIDFNQKRTYQLTYVLSDRFGNKAQYSFTVSAKPVEVKQPPATNDSIPFKQEEDNEARLEGMVIKVPKGGMMEDAWVKPSDRARHTRVAKGYMLAQKSMPLFKKAILRIKVDNDVEDKDKLYVFAQRRTKRDELAPDAMPRMYIPAKYVDGWMECEVDDIGNIFSVDVDDRPPRLIPINEKRWEEDATLLVDVKDEQTGVAEFRAFIDGQFILFNHVKKSSRMVCCLKDTPVMPNGTERKLELKARDHVGNLTVYDTTILY
ncbi:MAG: M23 family metallopeptidase [Prevotella sp.]|nr:M23 family metallopeptidase [Prevotella sp.]MBR7055355.1 M23 family metallopeptidase [Prevotella sp.]